MRNLALVSFALVAAGCNSETFFAGNLAVATVPCVLMYLTLNLKRERR